MIQDFLLGFLAGISIYLAFILTKSYGVLREINGYDKQKQAQEYSQAVQIQKARKPLLSPIKLKQRGRSITKTDDLVDMADLNWEDGYKAIEEIGNG